MIQRLDNVVEASKPVNDEDFELQYEAIRAHNRRARGIRRLVYASLGLFAGIAAAVYGNATDSRTLKYAGTAAVIVSTLYLGKRALDYARERIVNSAPEEEEGTLEDGAPGRVIRLIREKPSKLETGETK